MKSRVNEFYSLVLEDLKKIKLYFILNINKEALIALYIFINTLIILGKQHIKYVLGYLSPSTFAGLKGTNSSYKGCPRQLLISNFKEII